jgi:hypothetical protein
MATEQAFPSTAVGIRRRQCHHDAVSVRRRRGYVSARDVGLFGDGRHGGACRGGGATTTASLQPIQETHAPNSNRTTKTQDYGARPRRDPQSDGVRQRRRAAISGQCYVQVRLLRNFGGTAIVLGTLLGGYVTPCRRSGFRARRSCNRRSTANRRLRSIVGTLSRSAGTEIAETVPPARAGSW